MKATVGKNEIASLRVAVLGLGVSGRAAVKFLVEHGARVSVSERRSWAELEEEDRNYLQANGVEFEGGAHSEEFLATNDFLFLSPGIPTDLPLLKRVEKRGVGLLGELALAAPYLSEQVVAVTGTNGKTTVTALIGELLTAAGKKVFVGGNIGTPLLDYLRGSERVDCLVLELSSFQLELAGTFAPHVALLLNISPDHLDRHGSMEAYTAAKMNIFAGQTRGDKAIVCNDAQLLEMVRSLSCGQEIYCFGDGVSNCAARGSGSTFSITRKEGREERYSLAGTRLDSHTGLLNGQAAVLAVSLLGCDRGAIEKGLRAFTPAAHRLQHVRSRGGVDFYNDSKATNTGAVLSGLASFSGGVILIAGGREKGEDYRVLRSAAREKVRNCIVIGEAAERIAASLEGVVPVSQAGSMEEAVSLGAALAVPGDVVLLAPGCASFDMFDSYTHRGEIFTRAVMELEDLAVKEVAR